jgi:hypothetical protein
MQEVSLPEKQHWRRSSARLALKLAGRVLLCTARTTSTAEAIGAMGNTGEAGVGSPRLARVSHRNRGGAAIPLDATDSGAARTASPDRTLLSELRVLYFCVGLPPSGRQLSWFGPGWLF